MKTDRMQKIGNNCKFIKFFISKFSQDSLFLLLRNLVCFLKLKKTLHEIFFYTNFVKLDPDPHSVNILLDPDPEKNECGSTALLYTVLSGSRHFS